MAGSSSIVTTGALNSGSITSGFGSIDNGASAITTTGTITGGQFSGAGGSITGLNASNISSGTLGAARMAAAQTAITSLLATDIKIGEDDETKIDFETADTINFYVNNAKDLVLSENAPNTWNK